MREYLVGIVALVFLLGVCRLISYKDTNDAGRKFAFAVLILYAVFVPLTDIIADVRRGEISLDEFRVDISEYENGYERTAEEAFALGIRTAVCQSFSLESECVRVQIEGFHAEKMQADRIRIFLSGRGALANYKDIEKYIEENGLGECDAEIEIG